MSGDVTDQIPRWVDFVLAGGSTIITALLGLVVTLGRAAFNLRLDAVKATADSNLLLLEREKSAREQDVRELRARGDKFQEALQTERETGIRTEGKLNGLQGSINKQDDVLADQTAMLRDINRKIERRITELDHRKESKSGMPAVRPIPRVDEDSDRPPPPRPRLPSVRRGDGE